MSIDNRETLSALLDNEADDLELRRTLKAADQDPELLASWGRMSLVQALLHDENLQSSDYVPLSENKLSLQIAAAIAAEPSPARQSGATLKWGQSLVKVGIAASVALAFFVGMQVTVEQTGNSANSPIAQQDNQATEQISELMLVDSTPTVVDPAAKQRLDDYINSVSITPEEPVQLEQLQDSPLYRLVNDIQNNQ